MKILLTAINAKYIHSNLAVYSLKAAAEKYSDNIILGEYTINNSKDYILEKIYIQRPDVLCFSCYIWNIEYVKEIAKEFHKICPFVPIWVGGPEVSYEVDAFLEENTYITGIMTGEGEETFKELMEYYIEGKGQLSKIKGLAYKDEKTNEIVTTGSREIVDMSKLRFCYDTTKDFSNRIIYYESSRGCPFSCSYCLSSVDKSLRFRDVNLVKKELKFFIDQKVPQVKFVDRTFNCNHNHAMEIWKFIKENDNGVTNFHFEISADLINEEELDIISDMRPGLIQLEIGVQSTNEATIKEIHRTMKLERLKEVVKAIQKNGNIHEHLDLIAGLPYESYDIFKKSFDEIYALKPNQLQLGFLKVLKGSYMYNHANEYGICYHDKPPYEVLYINWLSYDEVLKIKRVEEMLEVYYNSGQFEITIKLLELMFESPFEMFQSLGDFYHKKGYFDLSHSRLRRCEIILEFINENGLSEYEELIKESLIFDLYYRENCKTRPKWACDMALFKKTTRHYCKNGKLSHVEPFHYRFPDKNIKTISKLPERLDDKVWVLFHYDKKDPLDNQAMTEYVTDVKENGHND